MCKKNTNAPNTLINNVSTVETIIYNAYQEKKKKNAIKECGNFDKQLL